MSSPDTGGPDLSSIRLTSRFSAVPETNYHGKYILYSQSSRSLDIKHKYTCSSQSYSPDHEIWVVTFYVWCDFIGHWGLENTVIAFDPCVSGDHFVTSNLFWHFLRGWGWGASHCRKLCKLNSRRIMLKVCYFFFWQFQLLIIKAVGVCFGSKHCHFVFTRFLLTSALNL